MNELLSPRSAIHAELEATRSEFHDLLTVIPDSIWQGKGIHSAWTIKEEMWHTAWGMGFILDLIRNARRGIGLPKYALQSCVRRGENGHLPWTWNKPNKRL